MNSSYTLGDAIEVYLMRRGVNDTTRADNRRLLSYFLDEGISAHGIPITASTPLRDVTPEHLDAYEYSLCHRERKLSSSTVFKYSYVLWTFFRFLVQREIITEKENPARFLSAIRPPRDADSKAIPEVVLRGIVKEIRHKPLLYSIRDEAIVRCLASGLRERELRLLELEHLDLEKRFFIVHAKGGRLQRRRFGLRTEQILKAWLVLRPETPANTVFVSLSKNPPGPLAPGVASQMVRRLCYDVVNRPYGSHSLRHWMGQWLADNGVPAPVVADALGITVEVALIHYFNQDDERVIRAVETYEFGDF